MDFVKNNIAAIARGVFLSSFAAFIFTSVFTSAAVGGPMFDEYLTASVGNTTHALLAQKLALRAVDCDERTGAICDEDTDGAGDPRDWVLPTGATATLTVTPQTVDPGAYVTLSWDSDKIKSCILTEDGKSISTYTDHSGLRRGPINTKTEYVLTCEGQAAGTRIEKMATVNVETATGAPSVSVTANPETVDYNGKAAITWQAEGATSCTLKVNGVLVQATSPYTSEKLTRDTAFKVTCTNSKGTNVASTANVTVRPAVAPQVSFTLTPLKVPYNGNAKLTWKSMYATKCVASGFYPTITSVGESSKDFTGLKSDKVVTVACDGEGNTKTTEHFTIKVEKPSKPTAELSVSTTDVISGADVKVTWRSTNADTCSVKKNTSTLRNALSGADISSGELRTATVFWLTCQGPGGTVAQAATVQVNPPEVSVSAETKTTAVSKASTDTLKSVAPATAITAPGVHIVNPADDLSGRKTGPLQKSME